MNQGGVVDEESSSHVRVRLGSNSREDVSRLIEVLDDNDGDRGGGAQKLILVIRNRALADLDRNGSEDESVQPTDMLQHLVEAFQRNKTFCDVQLLAEPDDVATALELLQHLVTMNCLLISYKNSSCVPAARPLSRLLWNPTSLDTASIGSPTQVLKQLWLYRAKIEGDFAVAWSALEQNNTLEDLFIVECSLDVANTKSFKNCMENLENDNLSLHMSDNKFEGTTYGKVAGDILVAEATKLILLAFFFSRTDAGDQGFEEMMQTLELQSSRRMREPFGLPELSLRVEGDSAHRLIQSLPNWVNLCHLRVMFVQPAPAISSDPALVAAFRQNGSLYSATIADLRRRTVPGLSPKLRLYMRRNKRVPKLLAKARKDGEIKLLVPALLTAVRPCKRLRHTTTLAGLLQCRHAVGPSEAVSAKTAKCVELKKYAAAMAALSAVTQASATAAMELESAATAAHAATQHANAVEAARVTAEAAYVVARAKWEQQQQHEHHIDLSDVKRRAASEAEFAAATKLLAEAAASSALAAAADVQARSAYDVAMERAANARTKAVLATENVAASVIPLQPSPQNEGLEPPPKKQKVIK